MSQVVNVSDVEKVIMDALEKYGDKAGDVFADVLPKIGKETVDELRSTSPNRTGDYANKWTYVMQTSQGTRKKNKLVVYNKKPLPLEFGHAKQNGGRVEGIPHVQPANEKADAWAIEAITKGLENIKV